MKSKKVSTGYGNDYTTGCLQDYGYFKDNYRLITVDLNKQKALDADLKAIQQIVFQGAVGGANNTKMRLYTILEKNRNNTRICKTNSKIIVTTCKWLNTAQ